MKKRIRVLKRRSLGAAISLATLLALLPGLGAGVAAEEWDRMQNARIEVDPEDGKSVSLAARVFLPEDPGRYPAILYVTPYSASHKGARSIHGHAGRDGEANWFTSGRADHGFTHVYAYVVVDVRGTGASDGDFCLFCEKEQGDLYDMIQWITQQGWSDGNVGMMGGSYAGISALLAAAQGHPALKAITPRFAYSDMYREAAWHNGMLNALFIAQWSAMQDAASNGGATDEDDPVASGNRLLDRAGGRAEACEDAAQQKASDGCFPLLDGLARPYDSDWYRERAVYTKLDRITVPTLLRGGWFDGFSRGTLWNFRGVASEHKKLLMVPWGHWGSVPAHVNGPHAAETRKIKELWLDLEDHWFDRFLHGDETIPDEMATRFDQNNIDLDEEIHYYDANTGELKNESAFPPTGSRLQTLYLTGDNTGTSHIEKDTALSEGTLRTAPVTDGSTAAAHSYVYRPTYGAAEAFGKWGAVAISPHAHVDQRADETQALTYTSARLEENLELAGPLELRFFAKTTAQDMDWVVKVSDVSPEDECRGTTTSGADRNTPNDCSKLITSGYLKASHYEVDEARSLPAEPWILNERSLPVEDELIEYRIDIWPTAWTIKAGNRLRIAIASSDVPNHPPSPYPGVNTIFHDAEHQSRLLMTVAGAVPQVELNVTPDAVTGNGPVHVTAAVTDPDGLEDVSSGTLTIEDANGRAIGFWELTEEEGWVLSLPDLRLVGPAPWKVTMHAQDEAGWTAEAERSITRIEGT